MQIGREPDKFQPVTIILDNEQEADVMYVILRDATEILADYDKGSVDLARKMFNLFDKYYKPNG